MQQRFKYPIIKYYLFKQNILFQKIDISNRDKYQLFNNHNFF